MNPKIALSVFVLLASVLAAEAIFFGVSVTGTGGNTIVSANPLQTAAAGFLAAALGLLTLDFLRRPNNGKRSAPDQPLQNELLDDGDIQLLNYVFTQLDQTDCYHRLVCDIAASGPDNYKSSASIVALIKFSENAPISSLSAKKGLLKLNRSFLYGEQTKSVETCEQVFTCPHSGVELDRLIAVGRA